MADEYIPGVCNIGRKEVKQRWAIGWFGLAATVVMLVIFVVANVPRWQRLAVFFIAATSAVGFLQAKWHFCAKFGLDGVFNIGPDVGKTDTVEQAEFRKQDRAKALQIIGLSVLIGAVVAAGAYFI